MRGTKGVVRVVARQTARARHRGLVLGLRLVLMLDLGLSLRLGLVLRLGLAGLWENMPC